MTLQLGELPATSSITDRTRRVYDRLAPVYPLSTMLFHSKAHRRALEVSGIRDGMRVLEIATGSGEMFRRLVDRNPSGVTVGLDLSPKMAARTHERIRREFPYANSQCSAVDARYMPFEDQSFDAVVCCYLFELLASADIAPTLREIHRVLRSRGTFTVVLIGQNTRAFNKLYKVCGRVAPAFWGRQVEQRVPDLLLSSGFRLTANTWVRQTFYPSRVICAKK